MVATFRPAADAGAETYRGTWVRDPRRCAEIGAAAGRDGDEAAAIVARARTGSAAIESVKAETQRMGPPLLYDLTELQRHANRLFGFSAQQTLDIAQALYERHKLISYPRTDSRHLSQDVAGTLPRIVQGVCGSVSGTAGAGDGRSVRWGGRFVDDAKVSRSPRDYSDGDFAGARESIAG